ncbi:MAG: putative phosphatase [Frankiales bacterium]|jgi:membrane-associated phospholipid phosphatase|nr:putative phosphatase [Frankiales bacterium]
MGHGLTARALRADLAVYRAVRGQAVHPSVVRGALGLSHFGEHAMGWICIGAAGTVLDGRRRQQWARATAAVVLAHGGNIAVKRVVRRPRPDLPDLPARGRTPSKLSFPSAHSASTFAAVTAFAPLLPRVPWRLVGATMALSRVVLGVHYPSDVLAGAALGVAVGSAGRTRTAGPAATSAAT